MRHFLFLLLLSSSLGFSPAFAESEGLLEYEFLVGFEKSELDGLTLGDDPTQKRLEESETEIEFSLRYQINDDVFAFFGGAFKDESEKIEPANLSESGSGFERQEIGLGWGFGEEVESELTFGRLGFTSSSDNWVWWDEELDAIRLVSAYENFEAMVGIAEEQARESTHVDFMDPEQKDVRRIFANLAWAIDDNQTLQFYYLDQDDDSASHIDAEAVNFKKADEVDANLEWTGLSYLGEFELDRIGEIELEINFGWVSGRETIYEFSDPTGNVSTVDGIEKKRVDGSAHAFLLSWTPAQFDDWSLLLGRASGSGDSNLNDNKDKSFRQTGIQGDSEVFGELYQPELSNMVITTVGVEYEGFEGIEIALLTFDYRQNKLDPEPRDVAIDLDTTGLSKDLGSEIDLIVTIEPYPQVEIELIYARFDPGKAYGNFSGGNPDYWLFGIAYEF